MRLTTSSIFDFRASTRAISSPYEELDGGLNSAGPLPSDRIPDAGPMSCSLWLQHVQRWRYSEIRRLCRGLAGVGSNRAAS